MNNHFEQKFDILLLDDSLEDRELYKRRLQALAGVEFDITEADDAQSAYEHSQNNDFDCYIVDYALPDSNGLDFVQEVIEKNKTDGKNAAIIIVTGQGSEELAAKAFKMGAHEYLTKKSISNGFFGRPVLSAIERAQLTAQLEDFRNKLETSNQALTEFTHTAAHDLKSPLRRINSYCEILMEDAEERLNEDDKATLERMMVNAKRMQNLINGLLSYSLINSEEEQAEELDLKALAQEVVDEFNPQIIETSASITIGDLPKISVYRMRMHQLFSNLVSNALKYKGENDPVIHIDAEKNGEAVTISVTDNGQGIPEEMQPHIFKDFKRLHTNDDIEGTGLGLSICKKIAQLHGGRLWVESEAGQGSTFRFTIRPV